MKSVDDMLKELYSIDRKNNYEISFFCGRWRIRNKKTREGIDTDAGFSKAKKWLIKDIERGEDDETQGVIPRWNVR